MTAQIADHEAIGTGYDIVESKISCVVTRFRVKSFWALLRFYLHYRRIRQASEGLDGLIASVFLIENLHTYFTYSIWSNADAILEFNGQVKPHIDAANSSFRELLFRSDGPELWSAQFRLSALSPSNLRWHGVHIRNLCGSTDSGFEFHDEPVIVEFDHD